MTGATDAESRAAIGAGLMRKGLDLRSLWVPVFVSLNLLLFVPYTTGAMAWYYRQGYVPVQPVYYMLGLGGAVVGLGLLKRPQFALSALLVLGVVCARAADATFLQRFVFPGEQKEYIFILLAVVFMVGVSAVSVGVMRRHSKGAVVAVAVATVLVCSVINLLEFLGFGEYSTVEGRAAGYLEDANNSAMAITLGLGVFVTCNRNFWWNTAMVALSGAGVLVTLSRSGMLVFVVMLAAWALLNLRTNFRKLVIVGAVGVPLVAIGVGAMIAFSLKSAGVRGDSNVEGRLAALFGGDLDKMVSGERTKDLIDGFTGIAEAPLAGAGTGAGTGLYMPHNQIVSLWIDTGLTGVLLYGGLLVVVGWKCMAGGFRGLLCLIPVVGYVPFSQVLVETAMYWLAVLVLISVTTERLWEFSIFGRRAAAVEEVNDRSSGELAPIRVTYRA